MNVVLIICSAALAVPTVKDVKPDETHFESGIPEGAIARPMAIRPLGRITNRIEYYVGEQLVGTQLFYDNGKLAEEKLFEKGKLHGLCRQYYPNGVLFAIRPYEHGKPHGTFKFWDDHGKLLGKSELTHGDGVLREYPLPDLKSKDATIPYVDGLIDGQKVRRGYFEENESIAREVSQYKQGELDGWSIVYRANGSLFSSSFFHRGKSHGVYRMYDRSGAMPPDFPQYYIAGRQVDREQYVEAAKKDEVLRISLDHDRPQ